MKDFNSNLVSFIIPVFNSEKYLSECVNSILRISVEKEVILIDDGSMDSSFSLCKNLADSNSQISFYQKNNGGASSARNVGIDKSKGEYIVFVDSDDTLDSEKYENLLNTTNTFGLIIYGMAFDYYQDKKLVRTDLLSNRYYGEKTITDIRSMFRDYFDNNCLSSACNKIFRSDVIKNNSIQFNEKMTLYEDLDFVIQYLSKIQNVLFYPEAVYHYRHDENHSKNRSDLDKVAKNLDQLSVSINQFSTEKTVHSVLSNLYISILISSIMSNNGTLIRLDSVDKYINNSNIDEEELSYNNKTVYDMLKKKQYSRLHALLKWRIIKNHLKKSLKQLIRR